jgi:predicted alpha/beta superfamily hydrolase
MKRKLLFFGICGLCFSSSFAQVENVLVRSRILDDSRGIKIQLPRNYDGDNKKVYPLIMVFDGDYLFEPVAGIVDYLSYWEEIPEAFVVGVTQAGTRIEDGKYDTSDFLPISTGARFFDFIQLEVIKNLEENYNIGDFKIAVGHDYMANFINFFLFSTKAEFKGYINLSPDIPGGFVPFIKDNLQESKERIWYSLTTGSDDLKFLKEKTKSIYDSFSTINNELVSISYKSFEDSNHYTFVVNALPFALQEMFGPYTPINETEYKNRLSKAENPVDYLTRKYDDINSLYSIDVKIRIADIMQVSRFITEKEDWEAYKDLAQIAKRNYPETLLPDYFLGRYFQKIGEPKKAHRAYQAGFVYEEAGGITKEMMLNEADKLKETFGF